MSETPLRKTGPTLGWTFLSNHAHVLLAIARAPEIRLRDVAETVGITERAVQRIVADLEAEGYLLRTRLGRRNRYEIRGEKHFRHPLAAHVEFRALLQLVLEEKPTSSSDTPDLQAPERDAPSEIQRKEKTVTPPDTATT